MLHQKGLNTIQIESNYQETLLRKIRGVYFNYVRVAQKQTAKSIIRPVIMNKMKKKLLAFCHHIVNIIKIFLKSIHVSITDYCYVILHSKHLQEFKS